MSVIPPNYREGLYKSDSFERISQRIRLRQDSPENWLKNDPVLESGEFGYEVGYPTGKLKIGTGSTRWSQLPYLMGRGPAGAAGPAGPPGKGIQIKGTTDAWPPAAGPSEGDLWLIGDPVPAGAPAGTLPGDGFVWTGTRWSPTGPIRGPAGEAGNDGKSFAFSSQPAAPANPNEGDLWLDANDSLNIWDGAQWVLITASATGTANIVSTTKPPDGTVTGELWIDPSGTGTGGGITVFEQAAVPAVASNGDLWLAAAGGLGGTTLSNGSAQSPALTMEDVDREIENILTDPQNEALKELKELIVKQAVMRVNGGYIPLTPDYEWQETTAVAGSGKVEACIRNGVLYLRGSVAVTTNRWTHVRTLPKSFPKPVDGSATVCVGGESGVAERLVAVFINPDGAICVSPLGSRITDFRVDPASCRMP